MSPRQSVVFLALLFSFATHVAGAGLPVLANGVILADGAAVLDVGDDSVPARADWNNDGKPDLILGEYSGYVNTFTNRGVATNAFFQGGTYAKMYNGTDLQVPGG